MFDFGNSNNGQKEAISSANGPVLITAGPGTGKTYTLVQRAIYLIEECGVQPENLFIATFTEKAAKELITRITNELARRNITANVNSTPVDFGLVGADLSKYSSVMYERDSIANDTSTKQSNADEYQVKMQYSAFSLAGEVARYLNISSILAAKILREAQDGMDVILADVNQYNAVLDDIIIPTIFHALFDVTAIQKTEDRDVVLLREPKDAAYYEFSAKDDLVITNKYPGFTPDEVLKSFHADTYCFDSLPEKECFFQYIKSDKVQEVYFTGMFTSNQGDLSVYYYDPESGRIRQYYPDFLAKMKDGTYQLIEVKGDNKIDDVVVQAKKEAALEMAAASGIKYEMYAGSTIMKTHVLESPPVNQTSLLP